jgi:hypothetical protein
MHRAEPIAPPGWSTLVSRVAGTSIRSSLTATRRRGWSASGCAQSGRRFNRAPMTGSCRATWTSRCASASSTECPTRKVSRPSERLGAERLKTFSPGQVFPMKRSTATTTVAATPQDSHLCHASSLLGAGRIGCDCWPTGGGLEDGGVGDRDAEAGGAACARDTIGACSWPLGRRALGVWTPATAAGRSVREVITSVGAERRVVFRSPFERDDCPTSLGPACHVAPFSASASAAVRIRMARTSSTIICGRAGVRPLYTDTSPV